MAINKTDVRDAIEIYINNNNRPCPAHYLTDKFGDDVAETILSLKKDGTIIGRRGRGGGIVFPDTVFEGKTSLKITAKPVKVQDSNTDDSDELAVEEIPF
jgi:hypothetical protein